VTEDLSFPTAGLKNVETGGEFRPAKQKKPGLGIAAGLPRAVGDDL